MIYFYFGLDCELAVFIHPENTVILVLGLLVDEVRNYSFRYLLWTNKRSFSHEFSNQKLLLN